MTPGTVKTAPDMSHIRWAFELDNAARLPLVGEQHPLRREVAKWMSWASLLTVLTVFILFGAYYVLSHRTADNAATSMRPIKIVRYTDLGVPPSIAKPAVPQINVARELAKISAPPPAVAIPEPVADEQAQAQTIATVSQMSEPLPALTLDDLEFGEGGGDSLVVDLDVEYSPAPDDFVAVESEPLRISIDKPAYPQAARTAGIEGTVMVRVLVGKNGKVDDVIYLDGPEGLRASALACARTAVFRPALMDHRPVEVWLVMPVTFRLR